MSFESGYILVNIYLSTKLMNILEVFENRCQNLRQSLSEFLRLCARDCIASTHVPVAKNLIRTSVTS